MRLGVPPEKIGANSTFKDLPQPQKIAVSFFIILAAVIVIFWVWQMQVQITSPFAYNGTSTAVSTAATSSVSIDLLKKTDTDGDGLSDYDEIYIYHTSPYLPDTDSDGILDLKEIQQKTDPNCPQGQNCNAPVQVASSSNPTTIPDLSLPVESSPAVPSAGSGLGSADQTVLQNALNGQADAATLRQLLISSGISSQADLDKISDADLLKSYQETLNSQNSSTTQP
ncbi:MAG: hypothetical protein WC249_02820 [Patescibacteria group bacterium]|jgi:hypothetical protein